MKSFRFRLASLCLALIIASFSFAQNVSTKDSSKIKKWFPKYDFNAASFQKPAIEFAPFARWWWPGNNVTKEELKREINLFADNHFGGVEIQPLNLFVPGTKEALAKVLTWDTPDYYENVKAVMEEALKRGLTVDMTDGSGWPPGGPHLSVNDGFQTLGFANLDVKGGENISIALPVIANNTGIPSRLVALLATKTITKNAADKTNTILLDSSSNIVLTKNVQNDSLQWKAPAGDWKIIAFWSKPAGSKGMTATPIQGPVVDHFNTTKVLKNYEHLFGIRTGLQPYFGNPMRSIFNDSYEFQVDRHYSVDFIDYFKKKRGYDITPWLPAEMQRKYNYASYMRPDAAPDFSFSTEDWRLRYDYDLTLSELLGEHFFTTSKNWMEPKGLLHRTQAYGLNMDMIAQAGLSSIPETESMLGPEANLKIASSGAHLYNRPIVSAESVVFINRAYTTTPQKIKLAVDKLFAAGVNQVIYHGVPYRYTPDQLGPEGWYPFSIANFSSNLGEGNVFWKDQREVNDYVNRVQYALRSGKPHADVLIYFPFMEVDGMPDNPEEILTRGYMEAVEGSLPKNKDLKIEAKEKWAEKVYPIINQLEASGITWDWVNDLSIQDAHLTNNKQISIRGNLYQALVLANDSIIQLKTAQAINTLAANGMNCIATGVLPYKQPSFLNWKANDKKTMQLVATVFKISNNKYIQNETELNSWIKKLDQPVAFNGQFRFTRQVQREMTDGSRIQFIWNKSNQWQTLSLNLDKKYLSSYWMNADGATITINKGAAVTFQLPPFGSVILYASTRKSAKYNASLSTGLTGTTNAVIALEKWKVKTDSVEINDTTLFDWRTNELLKYSSAEGIYTSNFQWSNTDRAASFLLDLGQVCFTAEIYINGQFAGKRIYAPYMLDITKWLKQGTNQVEVHVTTGQLNGYILKAKQNDTRYRQFKNKEDQLMAAGLLGPVVIRTAEHQQLY